MLKVVIADGHSIVRRGLRNLLDEANVAVVGECETGEETLRLAEESEPDLVILGLNLIRERGGIETCKLIKSLPTPPYVLVHTTYDTANDVLSCLSAGADSYINKRVPCEKLLDAVRRTARGEQVLLFGGQIGDPGLQTYTVPKDADLTPRELEVLTLKLLRHTNAEIARMLHISVHTVKRHMNSVYRKTGKSLKDLRRS